MAVAASIPHGAPNSIDSDATALPQRTTDRSKISYFDRFQFPLPPDWKAIILARKVGIGPVGV
jgi:hypothetical protein